MPEQGLIRVDRITQRIHVIRSRKIILDSDLARVYGVSTARLNQQVRRNLAKFPDKFLLRLTRAEFKNLMLQNATSSSSYGGRRKLPLAFTEHGAIMAATILNSRQAVRMTVFVVSAFLAMRETLASHRELAQKLTELEDALVLRLDSQEKAILYLLREMKKIVRVPERPRRPIGFVQEASGKYGTKKTQRDPVPARFARICAQLDGMKSEFVAALKAAQEEVARA